MGAPDYTYSAVLIVLCTGTRGESERVMIFLFVFFVSLLVA